MIQNCLTFSLLMLGSLILVTTHHIEVSDLSKRNEDEVKYLEENDDGDSEWKTIGSSSFRFVDKKGTKEEGIKTCKAIGGNLASINNQEEFDFIKKNIKTSRYMYIGLIDVSETKEIRTWNWVDGSEVKYTAWHAGEPSPRGGREMCTEVRPNWGFEWNDIPCSKKLSVLCKKALVIPPGYQKMTNVPGYIKLVMNRGEWDEARQDCQDDDNEGRSDLVVIDSQAKQNAVNDVIALKRLENEMIWIGLKQKDGERWKYTWVDGSEVTAKKGVTKNDGTDGTGYQNWYNSEQMDGEIYDDQHCLTIFQKKWVPAPCPAYDAYFMYICEFNP